MNFDSHTQKVTETMKLCISNMKVKTKKGHEGHLSVKNFYKYNL